MSSPASLPVICAWPVSSQYGPGSRFLYYSFVFACVFVRRSEWVAKACLAGALLAQAIAAIHGIVIAAVHKEGAIDMDIYGIFQVCAIGALASPWTARLSVALFEEDRVNSICIWLCIIVAGLLSISVEFFKAEFVRCTSTMLGAPLPESASSFPYGATQCGLVCSSTSGPFSPIRQGPGNNIDVVPIPSVFPFGTGLLLSVGCCIPAAVTIINSWILIAESDPEDDGADRDSVGENEENHVSASASPSQQNDRGRRLMNGEATWRSFEHVALAFAILAVVILGEINLFSAQMQYDTEPMSNVGQWTAIAIPALTLLRSLYLRLAATIQKELERQALRGTSVISSAPDMMRRIARLLIRLGRRVRDFISGAQLNFDKAKASDFPEIPGEEYRNPDFSRIQDLYRRQHIDGSEENVSQIGSQTLSTESLPYRRRHFYSQDQLPRAPDVDISQPRRRATLAIPSATEEPVRVGRLVRIAESSRMNETGRPTNRPATPATSPYATTAQIEDSVATQAQIASSAMVEDAP